MRFAVLGVGWGLDVFALMFVYWMMFCGIIWTLDQILGLLFLCICCFRGASSSGLLW